MKIPKLKKLSYNEVEELAVHVLGLDPDDDVSYDADLDELLYEKFEIDLSIFENVINALMPYSVVDQSYLTKGYRIGFVNHETKSYIVKVEFENEN